MFRFIHQLRMSQLLPLSRLPAVLEIYTSICLEPQETFSNLHICLSRYLDEGLGQTLSCPGVFFLGFTVQVGITILAELHNNQLGLASNVRPWDSARHSHSWLNLDNTKLKSP